MSKIYDRLDIEINEEITSIITAVQNDTLSRYLDVVLLDNGIPIDLSNERVKIYMLKPDGKEIFNDGVVTDATAGRCEFELTTQALGGVGVLFTQISVWSKDNTNTEILSTKVFRIFVTKSLITDSAIESSNEYGALVVLFQKFYEAIELMTDMVQNIGKPGDVAAGIPVSTVWEMLEATYTLLKLDKSVSDSILAKIGAESDSGDTATLFGRVKQLKEVADAIKTIVSQINTDMAKQSTLTSVQSTTNTINTKIGTSSDSSSSNTLFGKIKGIAEASGATRQASLTGVGATVFSKGKTSLFINERTSKYAIIYLGDFVVPVNGLYLFSYELEKGVNNNQTFIGICTENESMKVGGFKVDFDKTILNKSQFINNILRFWVLNKINTPTENRQLYTIIDGRDIFNDFIGNTGNHCFKAQWHAYGSTTQKETIPMQLEAGKKTIIFAATEYGNTSYGKNYENYIKNITVTYQPLA